MGRSGAEMTEWVRSMERPLLNTAEYLRAEQGETAAEPNIDAQAEVEVEARSEHALPFED
jgi:hypothetical protein